MPYNINSRYNYKAHLGVYVQSLTQKDHHRKSSRHHYHDMNLTRDTHPHSAVAVSLSTLSQVPRNWAGGLLEQISGHPIET